MLKHPMFTPATRTLLALTLATAAVAHSQATQTPPAATPKLVPVQTAKYEGVALNGEYDVYNYLMDVEPGARTAIHAHNGPELILVTGGELSIMTEKDGVTRTLKPGQTFVVQKGEFMQLQNNTSQKGSFLATILIPKGMSVTVPKS